MAKQRSMLKILESLCKNHPTVKLYQKGFVLKGSISKSKEKFHIGTSTSLFRVLPEDVLRITDIEGNEIT